MTKIKICGLTRFSDIEAVNAAKPDYIGFVFAKSRRQVGFNQAAAMSKKLYRSVIPVGVFVDEPLDNIRALVENGVIDAIQLHGGENEEYISKIRAFTDKTVIKAVSITDKGDVQKWRDTAADYLLLDKAGGGTGQCFDWELIGGIDKPFFLAGGLNIGNILDAIAKTNPFAVDISSGVETDGFKDSGKIYEIIRSVRNG